MRIAIIGLGLIGGSMGLALRGTGAGYEVVGFARRPEVASRALELGAVDRIEGDMISAVEGADVVIIATPTMSVKGILAEIGGSVYEGSIITDTASTKATVMEWAEAILPPSVSFIGGHPMAGKETSRIEAADGDLFNGCTYCLTVGKRVTEESREKVERLVRQIRANPLFIDASEHDTLVAGISHLPLICSVALMAATSKSPLWPALSRLAASGFRDITRLASGDPRMSHDICLTNREPIIRWINSYIEELNTLRHLVNQGGIHGDSVEGEGSSKLEDAFKRAREEREGWLRQ
jgi:prephenate dehydrogenase